MANPRKRLPDNVPGDYFVDSTCIDCDLLARTESCYSLLWRVRHRQHPVLDGC